MESQRIEIMKSASAPNDVMPQPGTSPENPALEKSASRTPEPAYTATSIESRLKAWVKSVEKDTQTQVQDYLEQIDAGQSGE
jgi:hypothetical protein